MAVIKNDRLLRVLNHLPVDRVPVWMMRQAGRTDPEYNQLKKNDGRALEKLFADPAVTADAARIFNQFVRPNTAQAFRLHLVGIQPPH